MCGGGKIPVGKTLTPYEGIVGGLLEKAPPERIFKGKILRTSCGHSFCLDSLYESFIKASRKDWFQTVEPAEGNGAAIVARIRQLNGTIPCPMH